MLPGQGEQLRLERDCTICFVTPRRSPQLQARHTTPPQEDLATSRAHQGMAFPQAPRRTQPRDGHSHAWKSSKDSTRATYALGPTAPRVHHLGPPALCPQVGTPLKPKHPPQRLKPYCCPPCIQSCPLLSWLLDWSPGGLQTYSVGGFVSSSTSCIASDWWDSLAFSCS